MQWKVKDCEGAAHKGKNNENKISWGSLKSLGAPGKYPLFPLHPPPPLPPKLSVGLAYVYNTGRVNGDR